MNKHKYVAIMAGGIGSRFWPKSRQNFPKQFLDILGNGQSLIQNTYQRFLGFIPQENIYILTSNQYINLVKEQLPNLPEENILAEPYRKNTAPCIAYVSFKIFQKDPEALMIIAPSDHIIYDLDAFKNNLDQAFQFVSTQNVILTLGIKPNSPNTGYGYIQINDEISYQNINKVKSFTEKPNLELAKTFIATGEFYWNSGIFIWKVSTILEAFKLHQPNLFDIFDKEIINFNTTEEARAIEKIFSLCQNISIDIAVLEKAENVYIIKANFGWNDLGTWNSIYDNTDKDYLENAVTHPTNVLVIDAIKSIISTPNDKLVIVQGLEDYIVVDTPDVLLICQRKNEQLIKDYVSEVTRTKRTKFL